MKSPLVLWDATEGDTGMRVIAMLLAVVTTVLTLSVSAQAQTLSPVERAMQSNDILARIRVRQTEDCVKPRSHTPARCNAAFDALYPKFAELVGWQILYDLAAVGTDASRIPLIKAHYTRSRETMLSAMREVERLYYPLPQVTATKP